MFIYILEVVERICSRYIPLIEKKEEREKRQRKCIERKKNEITFIFIKESVTFIFTFIDSLYKYI